MSIRRSLFLAAAALTLGGWTLAGATLVQQHDAGQTSRAALCAQDERTRHAVVVLGTAVRGVLVLARDTSRPGADPAERDARNRFYARALAPIDKALGNLNHLSCEEIAHP